MSDDQCRLLSELRERSPQGSVSLQGGGVEAIVRRQLSSGLPYRLHRIQLGRVAWQPKQLDLVLVAGEPFLSVGWKVVPRSVVDDEEDLAALVLRDQVFEKCPEGFAVEDVRESVGELRIFEADGRVQMSSLPHAIGVDSGLASDTRPRLMQRAVEPEARFVFEEDYSSARGCFFFIAGSRLRSQYSCFSASARASRLRGRCTEKPSWWRRRGT